MVLGISDCPFVILQRNWRDPGAKEAHLYQEPRLPLAPDGTQEFLYKFETKRRSEHELMEPEDHLLRGAQSLLNQCPKRYIKNFGLKIPGGS